MFTLAEAYEALNGHDEFAVKSYEGIVCFDYIVIFPGSFEALHDEIRDRAHHLWERAGGPVSDSIDFWLQAEKDCKRFADIRRNFRGVTFDAVTGEMISLPLHKFFNVNQTAFTQYDLIKDCPATIYEKLDGSMIHFFMHPNGQLAAATCRSMNTPQAQDALRFVNNDELLKEMIVNTIHNGYTPIFEFVALHNQIVVQYPKPRLVYLISRNRNTGEYLFDDEFPDVAQRYEFKFSEVFNKLDRSEFEGYVCHLPHMIVKAKTPWYMERHRAVDALMRPAYKLYQIVFDGVMDDLIAMATEPYKPTLMAIYNEAQRDLLNEKNRLEEAFQKLLELHRGTVEVPEVNKLATLIGNVQNLKAKNKRLEAIKLVRDFTGLGLSESKNYVENGVWPHGFIQRDEQAEEARRLTQTKSRFSELVMQNHENDFGLLMSMYQGRDPSNGIKERLMEIYRVKYPNKLYANLVDDS